MCSSFFIHLLYRYHPFCFYFLCFFLLFLPVITLLIYWREEECLSRRIACRVHLCSLVFTDLQQHSSLPLHTPPTSNPSLPSPPFPSLPLPFPLFPSLTSLLLPALSPFPSLLPLNRVVCPSLYISSPLTSPSPLQYFSPSFPFPALPIHSLHLVFSPLRFPSEIPLPSPFPSSPPIPRKAV